MVPIQAGGLIGSNPLLGPLGILIGLLAVMMLVYWTLQAWRMQGVDSADEVAEEVSASFANFVVAGAAVLITIGDQVIGLFADLVGLIDAPVVVGHIVGGVLGWLGVQGSLTTMQFLIAFGAVTAVALVWRASSTPGRGL